MNTTNISKNFSFNYNEESQLKYTVDLYAQDWSIASFVPKCWEALTHLFGRSQWMEAKQNLKSRSIQVIDAHFGPNLGANEGQAEALSEFVLRYLVSEEAYRTNQKQRLLNDSTWNLDLVEVLDRAPFGNGLSLPETPRSVLEIIYKNERKNLEGEIKRLEDYLTNLQQQFQPLLGILGDVAARTGKGAQNLHPFPELDPLLRQAKKYLEDTKPLANHAVLSKQTPHYLKEVNKAFREARSQVNAVYQKLAARL